MLEIDLDVDDDLRQGVGGREAGVEINLDVRDLDLDVRDLDFDVGDLDLDARDLDVGDRFRC